ncbi:hypothetical protein [Methanosphaera sp.]
MSGNYEILDMIRKEDNIVRAELISQNMQKKIMSLEKERLQESIPVINKGVEEAFEEKETIVIIRDIDKEVFMDLSIKPTLNLISDSGILIGEEIYDKDELEELHKNPNVQFLSENFVRYDDLANTGEKQYFIVSNASPYFVSNRQLKNLVCSLKVGLPSLESDIYIKKCFNLEKKVNLGTLIVGFTK